MMISVVVPTFKRPAYLKNCLWSILYQTRQPNFILTVVRDDDFESLIAIKDFIESCSPSVPIDIIVIHEAGFLPPIQSGMQAAKADIVAFIDDDAQAHPDWLEKLEQHYGDPAVGGVGGRSVDYFDGVEEKYKARKVQSKVFWYGRREGNLYCDSVSDHPVTVDGLMGCNMSYRKTVLDQVRLDWTLQNGRAYQYELDLGLQIKKLGFKLIYDPSAKIDHHRLKRPGGARQILTHELAYWMSFNNEYVIFKHSHWIQRCAALVYQVLIGQSLRWGLLSLTWYAIRFHRLPEIFWTSLAGRIAGIKAAFFQKPIYLESSTAHLPEPICHDSAVISSSQEPALPRLAKAVQ